MPDKQMQTLADFNKTGTDSPPVRTQFLIFTLFGDFIMDRGGRIWTSDLLYLMDVLGVSERAVRSTLSRMTRNKWLASHRKGRRSQYSLTARGRNLLERGGRRIFEPPTASWNGQWHLVLYTLPETKRSVRHTLRTQLFWLGFGRLAAGAWASPHNREEELNNLFLDLEVQPHVQMFCGQYLGPTTNRELVNQCWDLEKLANHYQDFITAYQQEYRDCCEQHRNHQFLDIRFCFTRRFWLTHEFQSLPLRDPNLPSELLPPGWIGNTARDLFANYRELLGTYANQFVDKVLE